MLDFMINCGVFFYFLEGYFLIKKMNLLFQNYQMN